MLLIANNIQSICNDNERCPTNLKGFESTTTSHGDRKVIGSYITYLVFYKSDGEQFTLYLYQSLDTSTIFSGGVSAELRSDDKAI